MRKQPLLSIFASLGLAWVLLAACGGQPVAQPTPTQPQPPTATQRAAPSPTPTLSPSPTPSPINLPLLIDPAFLQALGAAGLSEAESARLAAAWGTVDADDPLLGLKNALAGLAADNPPGMAHISAGSATVYFLRATSQPAQVTLTHPDGRIKSIIYPQTNTTLLGRDDDGNIVAVTDEYLVDDENGKPLRNTSVPRLGVVFFTEEEFAKTYPDAKLKEDTIILNGEAVALNTISPEIQGMLEEMQGVEFITSHVVNGKDVYYTKPEVPPFTVYQEDAFNYQKVASYAENGDETIEEYAVAQTDGEFPDGELFEAGDTLGVASYNEKTGTFEWKMMHEKPAFNAFDRATWPKELNQYMDEVSVRMKEGLVDTDGSLGFAEADKQAYTQWLGLTLDQLQNLPADLPSFGEEIQTHLAEDAGYYDKKPWRILEMLGEIQMADRDAGREVSFFDVPPGLLQQYMGSKDNLTLLYNDDGTKRSSSWPMGMTDLASQIDWIQPNGEWRMAGDMNVFGVMTHIPRQLYCAFNGTLAGLFSGADGTRLMLIAHTNPDGTTYSFFSFVLEGDENNVSAPGDMKIMNGEYREMPEFRMRPLGDQFADYKKYTTEDLVTMLGKTVYTAGSATPAVNDENGKIIGDGTLAGVTFHGIDSVSELKVK